VDIFNSDNLIAPLDAVRFILVYVPLLILPGFCMAALLRPSSSRLERMALATPCAYALVAVSGLVTALLHLSYGAIHYAVVAVPVVVLACSRMWRRRDSEPAKTTERWWLMAVGVSVVQTVAVALAFVGETVPAGFDALAHVAWVEQIGKAHVFPITLLSANLDSAEGGFYPPVFHVICAMVQSLAPMPAYRITFFVDLAAVALLPIMLYVYTRVATGSDRLAALATLAALAFEPLPFYAFTKALYTFIVGLLFVPAVAMALRDGLGRNDRRSIVLAMALGVGLFYTHPTEFVTVGLLALAIVPGLLRDLRSWLRAVGYGVLVAAVWALAAAPALHGVRSTMAGGAQAEMKASKVFTPAVHVDIPNMVSAYIQFVFGRNLGYLLFAAACIGMLWCVARRQYLLLAAIQVLLSAVFIDTLSYNVLHGFYALSYPWAIWERLAPTHYWVSLPLAGIGIDVGVRALQGLWRRRSRPLVTLAAMPVAILGLALPLDISSAWSANYDHARDVMAPVDVKTIGWLAVHVPQNAVVVNDADPTNLTLFDAPLDAGRWMPVLGGPHPLFWRNAEGPGPLDDRLYVLHHITDDPLPGRVVRFLRQYGVGYVFYGAAIRPGAKRHLNLAQLFGSPYLRAIYANPATCTAPHTYTPASCPDTGSYVFGITISTSTISRKSGMAEVSPLPSFAMRGRTLNARRQV
jgi:hypothetical protein